MVRVKVRVFTFPSDPREQNSFLVGTSEVGARSSGCCFVTHRLGMTLRRGHRAGCCRWSAP
jgi:hypothetical protein